MNDRRRGWLLVLGQFALLGALVLLPVGDDWTVPGWLRTIGIAGRLIGGAAIVLGALQLGTRAAVHPSPPERAVLRTDGAYRYVRHPIYSGVLTLGAAIAATSGSVPHVIAWALLLALLTVKATFEARLLTDRFPNYPSYAATTSRFLPLPHLRHRA